MYLSQTEEGVSFDERIHKVWDGWDIPRREQFICQAYQQLNHTKGSREETALGATCPEVVNTKILAEDTQNISDFLLGVALERENEPDYPWHKKVKESVELLLSDLNYDMWKTFTEKSTKKKFTIALV